MSWVTLMVEIIAGAEVSELRKVESESGNAGAI